MESLTLKQDEQQLVVFNLATEGYGVDISAVREIIRLQDITSVPGTPESVEGVINLRGRVICVHAFCFQLTSRPNEIFLRTS